MSSDARGADGQHCGFDVAAFRRDLHRHPELGHAEHRTTGRIVEALRGFGLAPAVLPSGTGVVCDLGPAGSPRVALRADIDALPLPDEKDVPYRSTVAGVCHGCGHDAHTAILVAAAGQLAAEQPAEPLPEPVRLVFQPAEETVPGGALSVLDAGVLDGVERIFALHCDPRLDTGRVGLRVGAITAACDHLDVELSGPGGHTSRPHLTADLVYAAGLLIAELPGLLSRRVDPRAGVAMVFGCVQAGRAANAIPTSGRLAGTLRLLDRETSRHAEPLVRELIGQLLAPTGVIARVDYRRGVPPVVNDAVSVGVQRGAVLDALGEPGLAATEQSMGGEDFAWYLERMSGALARLGVRRPGSEPFDLHQGTFDLDEDALAVGVRFTVALVRRALPPMYR